MVRHTPANCDDVIPFPKPRRVRDADNIRQYRESKSRCEYCGSTFALQVHHVKPRGRGGDESDNLLVLCADCHTQAHTRAGVIKMLAEFKEGKR